MMSRCPGLIFLVFGIFHILLINSTVAQQSKKYWVTFVDKGPSFKSTSYFNKSSPEYNLAIKDIHPRALQRRAKVRTEQNLVDIDDLPLYTPYVNHITSTGAILCQQIRWMNAASFFLTDDQYQIVEKLSFVKSISPVRIIRGNKTQPDISDISTIQNKPLVQDYGPSFAQVKMINVSILHELGITGDGVLIGMLDTGFRWRTHEALQTRKVIAEYDFIQGDTITSNQFNDSPDQDLHGTVTFSVVGGYKLGKLIGAAYDSEFIFGKTEHIIIETRAEEDNWAAALEWMERQGADIVNSSLGYNIFDDGTGYSWENCDFDGRTSVTARAALRATRLGVLVCNAMGNEGNGDGVRGTLLTPADADSILSVGAVTYNRQLAHFSSTGPTNDNRVKPDVVSPGVGVYSASTAGSSSYIFASGTSLATPLATGAAALVLSARPELTPIQLRNALHVSADSIDAVRFPIRPNNFTGWGLVNALNAALSFGPIFSNKPKLVFIDSVYTISIFAISKYGIYLDSVICYIRSYYETTYKPKIMQLDSSIIYATSGRYSLKLPQYPYGSLIKLFITVRDSAENVYQSPAPILNTVWQFFYGINNIEKDSPIPKEFVLFQNFPNPFNSYTTIEYILPSVYEVEIQIYNLHGQKIKTLFRGLASKGTNRQVWDGTDNINRLVPSGVYYYRLSSNSYSNTKPMMLIR